MRSWTKWMVGSALALACALAPTRASAQEVDEPWFFTLDIGVAGPLTDPIDDQFSLGGDGSVGVFRSFIPELAGGLQLHIGVLGEGQVVPQDPVDRGVLDYGMLTATLRIRPLARLIEMDRERRATGLYLSAAAGGALLDGEVVPSFEAGIGYNFGIGPVAIGPAFRFTHFIETEDRFGDNDVFTWTAGIELAFLDQAPVIAAPAPTAEVELPPPAVEVEPEPELEPRAEAADLDEDGIMDADDQCPGEAEVFNGVDDEDGCPDEGTAEFVNDALVVDERVFFDYDEAVLRQTGIEQLDEVVEHYRQYGDRYERLVISGHADSRGTMEYNEDLSRRRAKAVEDYLVSQGIPREVIDSRAYGEMAPAIPDAETEWEHQVNRRVAFRIDWAQGQEPMGMAPEPDPTMPEYVDPAPPRVRERERRADVREREQREREIARAELEAADEEDRAALERERLAQARVGEVEGPQARVEVEEAEVDVDVEGPQARVDVEGPELDQPDVQGPQARVDVDVDEPRLD